MSHPLRLLSSLRLAAPQGIIHVGANTGQEIPAYRSSGAQTCLYIEPIPGIFEELRENLKGIPNHYPLQALIADKDDDEVTFYVSNNNLSSSLLPLGAHSEIYPAIKYIDSFKTKTTTLDTIKARDFPNSTFDTLVLDVQGAELKALQGAENLLRTSLVYVHAEVSEEALYNGGCTFDEVTSLLKQYGFRLKNLSMCHKNWGDALYVKSNARKKVYRKPAGENVALNKPATQSSRSRWSRPDDAAGAVNGIKSGGFGFHTALEAHPWWQVDLKGLYALTEIWVWNRVDSNPERSRTLEILVSSDGRSWTAVYANKQKTTFGGIYSEPLVVPLNSAEARYVRLQLSEINFFHLDEVEVFGSEVR